jgi:hypothetical protein
MLKGSRPTSIVFIKVDVMIGHVSMIYIYIYMCVSVSSFLLHSAPVGRCIDLTDWRIRGFTIKFANTSL